MTSRTVSKSACAAGVGDQPCCTPAADSFDDLQAIVDDYRAEYEQRVQWEAEYFGDKRQTVAAAVRRAALSLFANGNLHGHQRRPGKATMRACAVALAGHEQALAGAASFAELHARVDRILNADGGRRELIVYDIAERIGWRLGLEPEAVYLHRGTRDGACLLRPDLRGKTVAAADLAPELAPLRPAHVENLLCIYKAALASLKSRGLL